MSTEDLDIRVRTRALIEHAVDAPRRFKDLEEIAGISAGTWRTFWTRSTYPSAQMLEALAQAWPQYAFWLVTGVTDPDSGHVAPPGAEPRLMDDETIDTKSATEYFRYQIEARKPKKPDHGQLDLSALEEFTWRQRVEDHMRQRGLSKTSRRNKRAGPDAIDLSELDKPAGKQQREVFALAEKELREQDEVKKREEDQARSTEIARTLSALRKRKAMTSR
ncbi:hypothetical protein [Paraburkholderia sediminicola]|uniref:hypothetical protein n=1 Tax=Paraburkholderia sediminicola TaxID=458836 RepID=UPI0038BC4E41